MEDKFKLLFNLTGSKYPSPSTHYISKFALFIFCEYLEIVLIVFSSIVYCCSNYHVCLIIGLSEALFCFVFNYINESTIRMYLLLILVISTAASYVILTRQPQNDASTVFKVSTGASPQGGSHTLPVFVRAISIFTNYRFHWFRYCLASVLL